jgi:hypothetical protein
MESLCHTLTLIIICLSGIVGRIAASMTRREVDHIVSSADRLKDCGGTVTTGDTAGVEESRVANISGSIGI